MLHTLPDGTPAGLVSNIQKYTIHDGPGIRTEVFFTGCTLRCLWCSNPETIAPQRRLGVYPAKCISIQKCGYCIKACPADALIHHDENGILQGVDMRADCVSCLKCAEACPARAIRVWGELYTVPQLLKIILEDRGFYQKTGGGATLSGGEVMAQWEFAAALLAECRANAIHTCVETALHCPWEHAAAVFEHTDLVIADIKHMDTARHREYTGAGNELILANLLKTAALGKKLVLRTPIVPGYNGGDENLRATAAFIRDELRANLVAWQLLPYRKMGTEKYASLGMAYPMGAYVPPERGEWEANLLRLETTLRAEYGIPVTAGSGGKLEL
ncbi:MAG: glycyl-radical enzyme activating protein [Oscillospiraceae bacterium]|nr:glycyl-radical enzyme activating protein [Oscillospiraceae bacterium]